MGERRRRRGGALAPGVTPPTPTLTRLAEETAWCCCRFGTPSHWPGLRSSAPGGCEAGNAGGCCRWRPGCSRGYWRRECRSGGKIKKINYNRALASLFRGPENFVWHAEGRRSPVMECPLNCGGPVSSSAEICRGNKN